MPKNNGNISIITAKVIVRYFLLNPNFLKPLVIIELLLSNWSFPIYIILFHKIEDLKLARIISKAWRNSFKKVHLK